MRSIVLTLVVLSCLAGSARAPAAQTADADSARSVPVSRAATVSGRVTDAAGKPVSDVSVGVVELRRGTQTDADGRYAIPALPPGTWRVAFQRLGYASAIRRVTFAAGATTVDVTLVESALELPGTQVSATANVTTALTSPQPTSVLEGVALRQARAATLGATLEGLPGLRSWSTGSGIGKPTIRGLRSDRVVIASEGLRLDNQGWGDEHGPQVESANVDRVEVIRGPASVLYGSDALGGVVHVLPRELPTAIGERPFLGGRVFGGVGSMNDNREGGLTLEGATGGFGARASITARGNDEVKTPEGALFNSGSEAVTGAGNLGVRGAAGSLDVSYAHREETIEIHEDPAEDPAATPHQEISDDLARLRGLVPLGDHARLEVNVGAQRNRRREFESAGDPEVALGLLAESLEGMARVHHPALGAFEGVVGVSWRASDFEKFGEESLVPASTGRDAALFAFEQAESGRWHLALGARYDHRTLDVEDDPDLGVTAEEKTWDAVTGNVGVLYRAAQTMAIALNLGRGFRAPSNFDLYSNGVHEGTVSFERGNPDLDVETSLNADLAFRLQSSSLRAEVTGFVHEIDGYIHTRPTGTFDPESGFEIFDTVQGDARLVGFEASAEAHPTPLLHVDVATDFVRGDNTDTGQPLPWIPPWRALYGVRVEPEVGGAAEELYVGLRGESVAEQARLDPADTPVGAYTLAHAEAGVALALGEHPLTIDLGVRNLFDRAYRDFMSRFKAYALAPGRNVTLRVGTRF
jgi:iron complex outermembrane receptor protein